MFRKFASTLGSFMHIFTAGALFSTVFSNIEEIRREAGVSKRIAMPLLIRFRLAKDLSTLSRVEAKVQLWGSLLETSWQRPFALEAFKVCTCTFTRHARFTDTNLDASA